MFGKSSQARSSFCAPMSLLVLAAAAVPATAQQAHLESAVVGTAGETLQITRVPVETANGKVVYRDIEMVFSVSGSGNLELKAGFPKVRPSPTLITSDFVPGAYSYHGMTYCVAGGTATKDGRTEWSIASPTDSFSASWTTGEAQGHPEGPRIRKAKIAQAGRSFGVAGDSSSRFLIEYWGKNRLIAATMAGDSLVLYSYSSNEIDRPTATNQRSLMRDPSGRC